MTVRRYESYRDSGVEWLGEVPSHWEVHRLKASVRDCRNGIWGEEPEGGGDDIICVRVADFDRTSLRVKIDEPTLRKVTNKERTGRVVQPGDLLIEKSGGGEKQPVGVVVIYDHTEAAVCSNFVARIQVAEGCAPRFWLYVHAAAYSLGLTLGAINQTSGIQNLDQSRYFETYAPYPPVEEQVSIAAFLDRETAKIDALVEAQRRLIELLKEKRQAVISHAVTKGLDPTAPMKDSGIEWLGEVPAHWEVRSISSVSTKITNGYVGPTREILVDDGVRYLQSLHIKQNKIVFDKKYFVSSEWSESHSKSILNVGDVLIVQTGDIGQCAVVTSDFAGCNCHALIIVSPVEGSLTGEWLAWLLNGSQGYQILQAIQTGALHPHLNCGDVKDVPLTLPPLHEQREIVSYIEVRLSKYEELMEEADIAIALLQERRAALISAAVTGKIDVRNAVREAEAA
jgi:type I restriction enzyme S subunit